MVWSSSRPDGGAKMNVSDNDLRENAVAEEAAIDAEHYFATGGSQTGRHKWGMGSTATRDSTITSPASGNSWINDTYLVSHGFYVFQVYDGAAWKNVSPYDLIPYLADANVWTGANVETYTAVTASGTGPELWDWDLDLGMAWKGTLAEDTTLNNPTGTTVLAADRCGHLTLQVTQDAGTPYDITTFGSNLLPSFGGQPAVNQTLGAITLIHMTLRSDQKWIYTVEYTS